MNILLFINDDQIVVAQQFTHASQKIQLTSFEWSDLDGFKDYLKKLPNDYVIGVLLDYIDEEIRTHWFPKLLPWEKPALEKRQVQKVYGDGAAFVNFIWKSNYQKNEQGRDEQEARISSIAKSDLLSQLFHFFAKQNFIVKSIYSTTFLIEGFFSSTLKKALKVSAKKTRQPILLLFRESKYVFRQVLLVDIAVKLTRLIEIDNNLENDMAIMYALVDEASLIVKYIYNQKMLEYNSPVGMIYLDNDQECREMFVGLYREKIVLNTWTSSGLVLDAISYQNLLKVKQLDESNVSFRQVLADYVFKQKPPSFYHNVLTKKINQLLGLKIVLSVLALMVFSVGAYYNGRLLIDRQVLNESTKTLAFKVVQYQQEINKIEQTIKIKFDAEDIKQVVDFSNKIIKPKTGQRLGFDLIGFSQQVLETHPEVQLTKIQWKQVGPYDMQSLQLSLTGELGPFQGKFKPSVADLDAFMAAIKSFPNVKNVQLIESPLELDLTKSFALSFNDAIDRLPFSLSFEVDYVVAP